MSHSSSSASSSSSSSSSSASSRSHPFTHHVFLSFRGTDTRFGFANHLYNALQNAGVQTFMDDYKLMKGEDISESLLQAIEVSRISVIIFSENYAASSWCLNELVKILECRKLNKQRVIPVFYKVEPAHVRHQTGSFGKALDELNRNVDKVHGWRAALTQAANLSGHYYKDGYEADKIREIVHNISRRGTESYNSNPKLVDEEYSLDRLFADEEYPLHDFRKIISQYGQNKVIFYTTMFGGKECDAVSMALEDSGVKFFERDVGSSPKFLSELRTLLRGHVRDPAVPCLFVNGRFLGDAKVLIELLKKGTLQKILNGLPKEADGLVCEVCGELRVACSKCSGTGHSFGWIRVSGDLCCDCGGNGLDFPCKTYRCEGGKITETVNNLSYLGTESCSSNAEIVYEEYPLDDFKQIISRYGQNKVIFYTTRFGGKICDAVSTALEDSGVEFFKRDVGSSPKFLSELRTLLRGHVRDPAVPCLFVNGRFLGDSKVLFELLKKGTLQKILDGLPKEADGPVCELCGELRVACSMCSGTGHSFGWIRVSGDLCYDCGGNGLDFPCRTYRCQGGKITETVNNLSYLGTESCCSNAEIVYEEYPLDEFKQIISRYGQNKVIFYTSRFGSKDCDAVSTALQDSGVEFFKRDVVSSPKFLSELRTLLRGHVKDPAVPCLFVNGRFLGDAKVLIELLKKGTLQKILDGLPKEADGIVCEVCGELIVACSKCSGTGHSFGWIRVSGDLCCDCGGSGLDLPCRTYRCEGGKIIETVNNISQLGTESCSSNAEIVYEEYPLDEFKQIISRYGQNKVIFYTSRFGSKDCDAVSTALEDSGVGYFKRDVVSSPKFLSELRTLLRGHVKDPAVPCLFVNGRFLGDAKVLIELLKKGTLQKILDGLPKEADGIVCEVCGELIVACSKCSGTGHSFGWIRVSGDLCCDCGGSGLDLPCRTYRCEGGKIIETVNNISQLGTESCSSNAEIVYEEYPLDEFKQIISRYGQNKVIFYTSRFGSKDCDAVSTALEDSGAEYFKRDVVSSPKFLSELRTLLRGHVKDPAFPCLFVNGRFLGDAKVLIGLLKNGTLKKILDGLPKEADGPVCEVCGELRVACSMCSGTGHSFGCIHVSGDLCRDCGGNGLELPCRTFRCENHRN